MRVVTFGCRLNIQESEAIRAAAPADDTIVVVNSCAVTEEAVRQSRQAIRRLARETPAARIVVTGCAATVAPGAYAVMPEVAHIVGNDRKTNPGIWAAIADGTAPREIASDVMAPGRLTAPPLARFERRARGFVQVQNGCDHRCTFCIIPFGRGPSRSLPVAEAIAAARRLVEGGAGEIVLTGVDLTSYGADLPGRPRLGDLVRALLDGIPAMRRLRLSSIDAAEVDPALLTAFAGEERLMPHLHLSLQSGDDLILKRMKRRHSRADAVRLVETLRRLRPDIVIGADLIAGFPTESEAAFRRSLSLIDECGITHLHAFPFSPRPGTPAARMPALDPALVRERAARLREAGARRYREALAAEIGRTRNALAEHGGTARTEHFFPIRLAAPVEPGRIVPARITAVGDGVLLAA